ncbi:MAG: DUF493 domain-containing protein [Deltaproteobacteria bacterium]|nr:DUF493 domain-containing protein [Deltaproteobacteria bacterium]
MDDDDAGDDAAGPLIGWSIGSGMASGSGRPIEDLVEYPCVFRFKAIAKATSDLVDGLLERVAKVVGRPVEENAWSARDSSGGRYVCLTIDLYVTSGQQVYDVYEALRADERVTHLL